MPAIHPRCSAPVHSRRNILGALSLLPTLLVGPVAQAGDGSHVALKVVEAARAQIGITRSYNPAYIRLPYPGGDVPLEQGVCTDVVIRAYRAALKADLQQLVHEDMRASFAAYPKKWGLTRPDRNIDHRRVPNLQVFLQRKGLSLPVTSRAADYAPGDLVTQMLPGNLPHIVVVSDKRSADGERPLVIHNIGAGAREEDSLFAFPITGRFRFLPSPSQTAPKAP